MTEESTAGHGATKGFHFMNDHLKRYFREKGTPHQKRMDAAFTRSGPLSKAPHNAALRGRKGGGRARFSNEAIRSLRQEFAAGATRSELMKNYGISRSHLCHILNGTARKSVK